MHYESKIAVFDLDGTLWNVNSHYELLNLYYKTKFFTSFLYRLMYKLVPIVGQKIRDVCFEKVSDSFIDGINFEFNYEIVNLLKQKESEGYKILIISNAPREIIIKNASKRLNCDYLCARQNEKLSVLNSVYSYSDLFVCTDNTTDIDLLQAATTYYLVLPNLRIKHFFKKQGFKNA